MSDPFVQVSLRVWDAWKTGQLTTEERDLALYICFETDFRTGSITMTLAAVTDELRWGRTSRDTVSRRLKALRELGFVEYDVTPGQRKAYVISASPRLLRLGKTAQKYGATSAEPAVPSEVGWTPGAEVSAEVAAEVHASPDAASRLTAAEVLAEVAAESLEEKRSDPLPKPLSGPPVRVAPPQHQTRNGRGAGWVDNLSSYTGCRLVRGTHALGVKYHPLGTDRPPPDWPHERPTRDEVLAALAERDVHAAASETADWSAA